MLVESILTVERRHTVVVQRDDLLLNLLGVYSSLSSSYFGKSASELVIEMVEFGILILLCCGEMAEVLLVLSLLQQGLLQPV